MKKITFIMMIILSFGGAVNNDTLPLESSFTQVSAESTDVSWISNIRRSSSLSKVEAAVRNSSVKVEKPDGSGYGSGTYGYYDHQLVVFTANHVIDDNLVMIVHGRDGEVVTGVVIYADALNDFAILKVHENDNQRTH